MTVAQMFDGLKRGQFTLFEVLYWYLSSRAASKLKVEVGEEFIASNEEAQRVLKAFSCYFPVLFIFIIKVNAAVILGDRPVQITITRLWCGLTMMQKSRIVIEFIMSALWFQSSDELSESLNNMRNDRDFMTKMIYSLGAHYPWIVECLINERDEYMTSILWQVVIEALMIFHAVLLTVFRPKVSKSTLSENIVVVVGSGHVPGIKKRWELSPQPSAITRRTREIMQQPGSDIGLAEFRFARSLLRFSLLTLYFMLGLTLPRNRLFYQGN
jgi:pheromone shutdown protein TraB